MCGNANSIPFPSPTGRLLRRTKAQAELVAFDHTVSRSQILQLLERVHEVLHAEGTVRLISVVKLATRTDKVPTLAGKRL